MPTTTQTQVRWMLVDARRRLTSVAAPEADELRTEIDELLDNNLACLNRFELERAHEAADRLLDLLPA